MSWPRPWEMPCIVQTEQSAAQRRNPGDTAAQTSSSLHSGLILSDLKDTTPYYVLTDMHHLCNLPSFLWTPVRVDPSRPRVCDGFCQLDFS